MKSKRGFLDLSKRGRFDRKYIVIPLIALLFIGLVFSSGCLKKSEAKEAPKAMFVGGAEGLELSFMPGLPPSEVFELTPFSIGVKLENKGEYAVPKGINVKIGGIPTGATGFDVKPSTTQSTEGELSGKQLIAGEELPGGFELFTFDATPPNYPGDTEVTIVASTCYPYESLGVATACIKADLFVQTTGAPEICKASGAKTTYNRGAPIQITSIEEIPMGQTSLGFRITVTNNGNGQVYLPGSDCMKASDINKVQIDSVKIGNLEFDCSPANTITLVDGEGLIFCRQDLSGEVAGEYEDLLQVTLSYAYSEQISKKVKVVNIPGAEPAKPSSGESGGTTEEVCSDSDGGNKPKVIGTITKGDESFTDSCDGGMLTEYYCEGDAIKKTGWNCPGLSGLTNGVCKDGACVEA